MKDLFLPFRLLLCFVLRHEPLHSAHRLAEAVASSAEIEHEPGVVHRPEPEGGGREPVAADERFYLKLKIIVYHGSAG